MQIYFQVPRLVSRIASQTNRILPRTNQLQVLPPVGDISGRSVWDPGVSLRGIFSPCSVNFTNDLARATDSRQASYLPVRLEDETFLGSQAQPQTATA